MECPEAAPFVSALHDGERVPAEVAEHINGCPVCREQLRDYAGMGAELRLVASRTTQAFSAPAWLPSASRWRRFWRPRALTARVLVPRFALGLGAAVIVALSIGLGLVNAQNRALWFQFQLYPADPDWPQQQRTSNVPHVVQAGYREQIWWVWTEGNNVVTIAAIVSVTEIQHGRVRLAMRPRRYVDELSKGNPDTRTVERDLGNLRGHEYAYVPGESLVIPMEGGGKLVLKGQVFDQQPKMAWGYPLEPGPDQMVLTHPVLTRDRDVLISRFDTSAMIRQDEAFYIWAPGEGYFTLALQPFEAAIKGEASWGEIRFTLDGHDYFLLSASPITGGDQPHPIWVSRDVIHVPIHEPAFFGTGELRGVQH